ncbi:MAG: bifunctional hydroxymethylpyrimidine kinase/phosphomethylpyrimidine kinase [Elusimicrobiales bacterium]
MKLSQDRKIPVVLTIAGSDPSGGAGIQADIKVFNEFCVYSMAVITSLTAQNTMGVLEVYNLDKKFLIRQLEACLSDIKPDAFKTGMISLPSMPEVIANFIIKYGLKNYVLDPIIMSGSGKMLCDKKTPSMMVKHLFPYAFLITPNINEAEFFSGIKINNVDDMIKASQYIKNMGPLNLLLKGGHIGGDECIDVLLLNSGKIRFFKHKRIKNIKTHGTGCGLSSAIVALIARGFDIEDAVKMAIDYTVMAIKRSLRVGHSALVLNHFWKRIKR